jgi:biopolymer transport protein ExbD
MMLRIQAMAILEDKSNNSGTFNMTPIIDVVFLLIVFFMLVCQFIVAENFEVDVPDKITAAKKTETDSGQLTTVTVMLDEKGDPAYAVGAEILSTDDSPEIIYAIAAAIDKQLATLPEEKRVVSLRCDKEILFEHTKYALAGISQSSATDIKWAVIKQKQPK